jgi:hypothetical protein
MYVSKGNERPCLIPPPISKHLAMKRRRQCQRAATSLATPTPHPLIFIHVNNSITVNLAGGVANRGCNTTAKSTEQTTQLMCAAASSVTAHAQAPALGEGWPLQIAWHALGYVVFAAHTAPVCQPRRRWHAQHSP